MTLAAFGHGSMNWPARTGTLNLAALFTQANGSVLFVTGFSRQTWSGIPLPFEVPGSTTAPSGTCRIHCDAWLIRPAVASMTGDASNPLTFGATPNLNGLTVYSQVCGLDAAANPMGITTSNLLLQNLVAPYGAMPISRIFSNGGLGATGTVSLNTSVLPTFFN